MECPRCNQGIVDKVFIAKIDVTVQVCSECDAAWPENALPRRETFVQFQDFLDLLGMTELDEGIIFPDSN